MKNISLRSRNRLKNKINLYNMNRRRKMTLYIELVRIWKEHYLTVLSCELVFPESFHTLSITPSCLWLKEILEVPITEGQE
jgi:hypothetical protein